MAEPSIRRVLFWVSNEQGTTTARLQQKTSALVAEVLSVQVLNGLGAADSAVRVRQYEPDDELGQSNDD
jgi:hypothetical protein